MKLFGTNSVRAIDRVRYILLGGLTLICLAQVAHAQIFQILSVAIEGNRRIESATIQSFTQIETGDFLNAGEVNDAVQRVRDSQLFESVSADVAGSVLKINVVEFPTVNVVVFEGNSKLKVEQLEGLVLTTSSRVYSESQVRDDANSIAAAYADQGRISASVDPRIIQRSDNRVDVVFEIVEGDVVEIERISFVGNRTFADSRLRRVLRTKQAGLFRVLVSSDTFLKDRIEFDKQVLGNFYKSRGFVDFQTLSVNSE
ncbi:MAG: POTRA domain-containing protein, partial [Planktomarina sp.]|nr:POTRA domain-containing protein [Planktomarina sp.]